MKPQQPAQQQKHKTQHTQATTPAIPATRLDLTEDTPQELERKQEQIKRNAATQSYHTLLPISVQQALKNAVGQNPENTQQKYIAINEVIQKAMREYGSYFQAQARL